PTSDFSIAAIKIIGVGTGNKVRNNILPTIGGAQLLSTNTNYVTSSVLLQGNDYWPSGGSFLINWGGVTYTSLSAWRTATGQEKSGLLATGLATNPMLAAPASAPTIGDATKLYNLTAYQ